MEKGRRRGDEWKLKQYRWNRARSMDDVTEPATLPVSMPFSEFVAAVTGALKEKSEKYGKLQCSGIDALVYVNLTATRFLDPCSPSENSGNLEAQGWRSVCVLFPPYGVVLFAREAAPHFLLGLAGKTLNNWQLGAGWQPGMFKSCRLLATIVNRLNYAPPVECRNMGKGDLLTGVPSAMLPKQSVGGLPSAGALFVLLHPARSLDGALRQPQGRLRGIRDNGSHVGPTFLVSS